ERARRVDTVFAVSVLDDRAGGVADRPVVDELQVLQGVDQPALQVAGPARPDGRVDETFATTHRVEEVLRRREAVLVVRGDEAARVGAEIAPGEVRERPVVVAAEQSLAPDRLLADGAGTFGAVE